MIATLSRRADAARRQWSDPRARALLLARQLIAAERRRVDRLVHDHLHLLDPAGGHAASLTGLDKDDMMQAAFLGLRRAAETFDPTKGAAFGTWAYWWMKAMCQDERFRMRSTIRVPRRAKSPFPQVSSLDVEADDGSTFGALLVDEDAATPADAAHRSELRERVAAVLGTLKPRDALVIELRFGINGAAYPHTYPEIAGRLGVCTQRAQQIERRALAQLRNVLSNVEL